MHAGMQRKIILRMVVKQLILAGKCYDYPIYQNPVERALKEATRI